MTDAEVMSFIAFLGALTDQAFVTDKRLSLPGHACGKRM
jgi:hypothetical protein